LWTLGGPSRLEANKVVKRMNKVIKVVNKKVLMLLGAGVGLFVLLILIVSLPSYVCCNLECDKTRGWDFKPKQDGVSVQQQRSIDKM
jgi:hypothetical protein